MNDCAGRVCILDGKEEFLPDHNIPLSLEGNPVYEVLRIYREIPLFVEDHLERIKKSFSLIGKTLVQSDRNITSGLYRLIKANRLENGAAKMIFAGTHCLIYSMKPYLPSPSGYETGVKTILMEAERIMPNAKIWSMEFRDSALKKITDHDVFESLLQNAEGYVTEGSRSNVFFIREHSVFTPPETDILPGITRKKVLHLLIANGIKVHLEPIHISTLKSFETVFLSGTTRKIVPVKTIGQLGYNPSHPLLKKIMIDFDLLVEQYVEMYKNQLL
ncbi:MAG: aminotransferase class IV family protein [Bacteroidales bacterium]|nr:aminotransferase class IV family protein [Bacteroidales bacterium]